MADRPSRSAYKSGSFPAYPDGIDDLPRMLQQQFDVVIVDLDSNPEYALRNRREHLLLKQRRRHGLLRAGRPASGGSASCAPELASSSPCPWPTTTSPVLSARVSIRQPASRLDQKSHRQPLRLSGRQRRLRRHHHRFQLCSPRWPRNRVRNTLLIDFGLPLGGRRHQPRHGDRIFHRQRSAGF